MSIDVAALPRRVKGQEVGRKQTGGLGDPELGKSPFTDGPAGKLAVALSDLYTSEVKALRDKHFTHLSMTSSCQLEQRSTLIDRIVLALH